METKVRQAKIESTQLHAQGKWLSIKFEDLEGIFSNFNMFSHIQGSFGEVTFKGINREFVEELISKLETLYNTWEISS